MTPGPLMTALRDGRQMPRLSLLDRGVAMRLAATEYGRVADLFAALTPEQWAAPTNCTGWDVKAMAAHLLGVAEMAASMLEQRRQTSAATHRGGVFIDALTAIQVEKHQGRTPDELRARWARTAPRALRGRRHIPSFIRRRAMPQAQEVNGVPELWSIGFLTETIMTRDPWMHRLDIAAATGVTQLQTREHDGVIIDDLVREWADRHGQAVELELSGPGGGYWVFGTGGERLQLDAIDFCCQLGGRAATQGLTTTQVPF